MLRDIRRCWNKVSGKLFGQRFTLLGNKLFQKGITGGLDNPALNLTFNQAGVNSFTNIICTDDILKPDLASLRIHLSQDGFCHITVSKIGIAMPISFIHRRSCRRAINKITHCWSISSLPPFQGLLGSTQNCIAGHKSHARSWNTSRITRCGGIGEV